SILDDLRDRTARVPDDRRAAGHRLDHHEAEGLGPADGEQEGVRAAEERRLVPLSDLTHELHVRLRGEGTDLGLEVVAIRPVDLRGDPQASAGASGDLDRLVETLLRRNAAEKREVSARTLAVRVRLERQAVVDGTCPREPRQGPALRVR